LSNRYVNKLVINGEAKFDLTGDTITAEDLKAGKTAHDRSGSPITGTLESPSAGSATTPATTITSNPTIDVSSSGLITAYHGAEQSITPTVVSGLVTSGTAGVVTVTGRTTQQMTTKGATTYTPTTTNQTIAASTFLTGIQTIKGDANLKAANIASGTTIFGIAGTHKGGIAATDAVIIVYAAAGCSVTCSGLTFVEHAISGQPSAFIANVASSAFGSKTITESNSGSSKTITVSTAGVYEVSLYRKYLFKAGDSSQNVFTMSGNATYNSISSNYIEICAWTNGTYTGTAISSTVDISKFSTLKVESYGYNGCTNNLNAQLVYGNVQVAIGTRQESSSLGTMALDISNVSHTDDLIVKLYASGTNQAVGLKHRITNVWVE